MARSVTGSSTKRRRCASSRDVRWTPVLETMVDASFIDERLQRITSRQNAKVKQLRQVFHLAAPNGEGEVAIEGMHLVEEAIRSGPEPCSSASRRKRAPTSCFRNCRRKRKLYCSRTTYCELSPH